MDVADRASDEEERSLAEALRTRQPSGPAPTGRCLYCDELVADGARWCGPGCRDEWQGLQRRRA